jgi:hypothetical protein
MVDGSWRTRCIRRCVPWVALVATQWFERLGATPLSVLVGGVLALAFAALAWKLNERFAAQPAPV